VKTCVAVEVLHYVFVTWQQMEVNNEEQILRARGFIKE
jgi:hypothetical protein